MPRYMSHFALATDKDGNTVHLSGPHFNAAAANKHMKSHLQRLVDKDVAIASAGVFSAEYEGVSSIPTKAAKPAAKDEGK